MTIPLSPSSAPVESHQLLERLRVLARDNFAQRADDYDRTITFPVDDFADLFHAGLLAPAVPTEYDGLGLGMRTGLYDLWMMTKEIAAADMSLARCWEGHVNSQLLLSSLANAEQQQRWFEGIVRHGELWACWSGEPQSRTPQQKQGVGTNVEQVEGGFVVRGTKVFATSAGHAKWAILLVNLFGPGGARHASDAPDGLLLLAVDLDDESIRFDDSWWDPIGMRGTVSQLVQFNETLIPAANQIGLPGQYLREQWQTLFSPHYGATFLGGAEAALRYALEYLGKQRKTEDPFVQQRLGRMSINVETAHLWLRHVAGLWQDGHTDDARQAGVRARFIIEQLATETLDNGIRACGARCLIRPSPIERIYRDLSFYVRHDNADHVLASIGSAVTGHPHDISFFNPLPRERGEG